MPESTIISQFGNTMTDIITGKTLKYTQKMIQKYNGETDALLVSDSLTVIMSMLEYMKKSNIKAGTPEAEKIKEEFKRRWLTLDKIAEKARGKRPMPKWSDKDKKKYAEIQVLTKQVFGDALPIGNIVPMMLEAGHE